MAKKKKEKIVYYDDNSTLVDMSSVTRNGKKAPPRPPRTRSTFKDQWRTYWSAVKMMVIPMCVALLLLAIMYLVIMFSTGNI
jgi:hypothetical protein